MPFPGEATIAGSDNTEHVIDDERFYSKDGRWHRGPVSKHFDAFHYDPANPGASWARLELSNAPARHVIRMTASFKLGGSSDVFLRLWDSSLNLIPVMGASSQRFGANYWGSGGMQIQDLSSNGMTDAAGIPLNCPRNDAHLKTYSPFQTQIHMYKDANGWTGVRTTLQYFSDGNSPLQSEHYVSFERDISTIRAVGIGTNSPNNFGNMEICAEYW